LQAAKCLQGNAGGFGRSGQRIARRDTRRVVSFRPICLELTLELEQATRVLAQYGGAVFA